MKFTTISHYNYKLEFFVRLKLYGRVAEFRCQFPAGRVLTREIPLPGSTTRSLQVADIERVLMIGRRFDRVKTHFFPAGRENRRLGTRVASATRAGGPFGERGRRIDRGRLDPHTPPLSC